MEQILHQVVYPRPVTAAFGVDFIHPLYVTRNILALRRMIYSSGVGRCSKLRECD